MVSRIDIREMPCPNCGSHGSLDLGPVENPPPDSDVAAAPRQQVLCINCGFVTVMVRYTCETRCCAPKGYGACPICRSGTSTDDQCFVR